MHQIFTRLLSGVGYLDALGIVKSTKKPLSKQGIQGENLLQWYKWRPRLIFCTLFWTVAILRCRELSSIVYDRYKIFV
jgi:hypothetical protein